MEMTDNDFVERLENQLNGDTLYEILYNPMREFLLKNTEKEWNGISAQTILQNTNLKQKPSKAIMINGISRFFSNSDAAKYFYHSLPEEDRKIIEKATWHSFLTYKDLNEIYGKAVVYVQVSEQRYGHSFNLIQDKALNKWRTLIHYHNSWYGNSPEEYLEGCNLTLTFPLMLREIYTTFLPKPKGYYLEVAEAPGKLTIFNAEQDIFKELPTIVAYYKQGNIRYTQKGYPNAASGRKMNKALQLKSFPDEGEIGLRAMLIAGLFADDFKIESNYASPLAILKKLFERDFRLHPTAPYLLIHLKGINNFQSGDFRETTSSILAIFKQMPAGWITFENLQLYASTHFIELMPIYSFYDASRLIVKDFVGEEISINGNNYKHYGSIPNLAGHVYLLAAFGLMELSIDTDAAQIYSYYDGLRAFRLTDLGAYLLGLKEEYSLPEISDQTKFSFDESSPIIRIEGNVILADTMLSNYAEKVSENRYQLNPGNFLKDCKTETDLKNKITLFKQTIVQHLPVFWEDYLDQLVQNCNLITRKNKFHIYELSPENKELHRLIAQDPVLRSIIIKAEKFHILIKESHKDLFSNRMKELGYLI